MKSLMLMFYILTGTVEKGVDGDPYYYVMLDKNDPLTWYCCACEGEVMQWIETGEFKYNEELCSKAERDYTDGLTPAAYTP